MRTSHCLVARLSGSSSLVFQPYRTMSSEKKHSDTFYVSSHPANSPVLEGMRVAILVDFSFEDSEVIYPLYRLREAGAKVDVIGPGEVGASCKGKYGYPVKVAVTHADVSAKDYDGVVIPGGWAPDYLRRVENLKKFVKELDDAGKAVAAICHGPWMLVSAKVLKGRKATSFHAIRDDVENAGAIYQDETVVVDGNLITSRTPEDLPNFTRALIDQLLKQKDAK